MDLTNNSDDFFKKNILTLFEPYVPIVPIIIILN